MYKVYYDRKSGDYHYKDRYARSIKDEHRLKLYYMYKLYLDHDRIYRKYLMENKGKEDPDILIEKRRLAREKDIYHNKVMNFVRYNNYSLDEVKRLTCVA